VKVVAGKGNNLHQVVDSTGNSYLVSMPTKVRLWIPLETPTLSLCQLKISAGFVRQKRGKTVHLLFMMKD
jgi:hypothetical protein